MVVRHQKPESQRLFLRGEDGTYVISAALSEKETLPLAAGRSLLIWSVCIVFRLTGSTGLRDKEEDMKRMTLLAAIIPVALGFGGISAQAHSKQEATQPANGAVLSAAPEVIVMTFDMPMRVTLFTLTDQDGAKHDINRSDNMQPVLEFAAEPGPLPAGQYTVEWRGLAADGHPMQGTFGFEVAK